MKIPFLGLEISRTKAAVGVTDTSLLSRGWTRILEPFSGAWQRNISWSNETVVSFAAVYSCMSLISSDVGKLRVRLVEMDANGVWNETDSPSFSPVLRKPNRYQTRIQFFEYWLASKLLTGNAYILKQRDNRGVVVALYVLDPNRVRVSVTPDGDVWYQLGSDNLTGIGQGVSAPASEIIHDRMATFFHPLVGLSPIMACGLAATQGLNIQKNASRLFGNDSRPSGVLTSPTTIPNETAKRLQDDWQANFAGENYGKVAVLGSGLEYKAMTITPTDAQMIEQLKWTAEDVCTAFRVPAYMIGKGNEPTYNNAEVRTQHYYAQCLQSHIESIELLLDEGLGLLKPGERQTKGAEFDLDDLLRMDSATQVKTLAEGVRGGLYAPNEARSKMNLKPVKGGNSPYLQHQDYSLEALSKRDAKPDPFESKTNTAPAALPAPSTSSDVKRLRARLEQKCLPVTAA